MSIDQLVDGYAELAALIRPTPVPRLASDPDDDVVIGTALAALADCIVTGDYALRSLREHQSIRIVSVREAMDLLPT